MRSAKEGHASRRAIYTIGYQNLPIEKFLEIVTNAGIKLVLDVRNNAFSFKRGYTKKWLSSNLPQFSLEYRNIPELGIPSTYRKRMRARALWRKYAQLLDSHAAGLRQAADELKKQPTVLMCYEADHTHCHRAILARRLRGRTRLPIMHYDQTRGAWINSTRRSLLP